MSLILISVQVYLFPLSFISMSRVEIYIPFQSAHSFQTCSLPLCIFLHRKLMFVYCEHKSVVNKTISNRDITLCRHILLNTYHNEQVRNCMHSATILECLLRFIIISKTISLVWKKSVRIIHNFSLQILSW